MKLEIYQVENGFLCVLTNEETREFKKRIIRDPLGLGFFVNRIFTCS